MTTQEVKDAAIVLDWEKVNSGGTRKTVKVKRGGYDVTVMVVDDDNHDWGDCRGKFTTRWEEGAVKNPEAKYDRNTCEYFVPEVTVKEHIKAALETGDYTLRQAREMAVKYVREDMDVARDPVSAGYWAYGVIAKARLCGVKLGEDSLWGIEIKDDDAYLDDVAQGCIGNAVEAAQEKLAELVKLAGGTNNE